MIDPRYNQLLAALPATIYANWQPKLELVEMPLGKVLYESGSKLSHVYFSDERNRLAPLRLGRRRFCRNRGRRPRGARWRFNFYGRYLDAQPRRCSERRARVSDQSFITDGRIQQGRPRMSPFATLHPGASHANVANGCL